MLVITDDTLYVMITDETVVNIAATIVNKHCGAWTQEILRTKAYLQYQQQRELNDYRRLQRPPHPYIGATASQRTPSVVREPAPRLCNKYHSLPQLLSGDYCSCDTVEAPPPPPPWQRRVTQRYATASMVPWLV